MTPPPTPLPRLHPEGKQEIDGSPAWGRWSSLPQLRWPLRNEGGRSRFCLATSPRLTDFVDDCCGLKVIELFAREIKGCQD